MDMLFDDEMLNAPEEIKIPSLESWIKKDFKQVDYRIALPTYKRYECLKNKTLKTLIDGGINPELIDIFVANEDEKKLYEKTLTPGTYSKIIVGVIGMKNIRNFIQDYYPENAKIINFDDDVEEIEKYVDEKNLEKLNDLNSFFCYAFDISQKFKSTCWGVYAVDNPYFMDNSVALGLRFLNGTMYGFENKSFLKLELDEKEDFERSIKSYIHDNTVVRFDFITYKSKEFTEKGGMQEDYKDRNSLAEFSAKFLIEKYPELCKINTARKNRCEVKLVEQRPEYKKYNKRIHFEEE